MLSGPQESTNSPTDDHSETRTLSPLDEEFSPLTLDQPCPRIALRSLAGSDRL